MRKLMSAALAGLALMIGTLGPVQAEPLTVGAPPSLRPAFQEIVPLFEEEHRSSVTLVYAPSKTLLGDIKKGAHIDVFVSAGVEEVEDLHRKGLTLNGAPRIIAQTSLVLVMSADSPATLVSLGDAVASQSTRVALGDPEKSYLGEVTARALSKAYPTYKSRTHVLYAPHTEDIVELIRTGKADVGLVYRANVINNGDVRISDELPVGREVQVQFAQAVTSTCRPSSRAVAKQFSDFLTTPRIIKLLEKYGFEPPKMPVGRPVRSDSLPSSAR